MFYIAMPIILLVAISVGIYFSLRMDKKLRD